MSADPAMADGLNWYRYANNNPIMYMDPTGLNSEPVDNDKVLTADEALDRAKALEKEFNDPNTTQERKAEIGKEARALINSLDYKTMRQMFKKSGRFMDQDFRDVLNTTDHGGEWTIMDVFEIDENGDIIYDENGMPKVQKGWEVLPDSQAAFHQAEGADKTYKVVNDDGREVIFAQMQKGGPLELYGSSLHRDIGTDRDAKRGTFNYADHRTGSAGSLAHSDLDVKPWAMYEPQKNREFWGASAKFISWATNAGLKKKAYT